MRRFALVVALVFFAAGAQAGTIVSTVGGLSNLLFFDSNGVVITIDSVVTFGPTTVGGAGAAVEVSFDYGGGSVVGGGGTTNTPPGMFDLSGGSFTCGAGHCENIAAFGDFTGFGAVFPSGATFALPSITIDLTGLGPGSHFFGAGLTGPADAIVNPGAVDLSGEYSSFGVTVLIPVPEPGTAALLALGLGLLGVASRR